MFITLQSMKYNCLQTTTYKTFAISTLDLRTENANKLLECLGGGMF